MHTDPQFLFFFFFGGGGVKLCFVSRYLKNISRQNLDTWNLRSDLPYVQLLWKPGPGSRFVDKMKIIIFLIRLRVLLFLPSKEILISSFIDYISNPPPPHFPFYSDSNLCFIAIVCQLFVACLLHCMLLWQLY